MAKQQKDNEIIEIARSLRGTPWCEEYELMISGMLYVSSLARDSVIERIFTVKRGF